MRLRLPWSLPPLRLGGGRRAGPGLSPLDQHERREQVEHGPLELGRFLHREGRVDVEVSGDARGRRGDASGQGGGEQSTMYFTVIGPRRGPFLWAQATGATIIVLEAPDRPWPIGTALPVGSDDAGVARWRLTVNGAEVPGLWVVVDREFRPAE
jgi:hypothetical protein